VFELLTGRETLIAEARSVDNQVGWRDGRLVPFALSRTRRDVTTSGVSAVPPDGTGAPSILTPEASSSAAV
jgi:hypothetical protein